MPKIAYGQNAEDIIIARVFGERATGFYLDIGASHPNESITTSLYEQGWSGVNVEPLPLYHAELEAVRPRDRNLAIAISDRSGTATLFANPTADLGGLSTLDADQASKLNAAGIATEPLAVPVRTLAELCAEFAEGRTIDLLKIDVEGHEGKVIAGGDWLQFRPRVVVVEATEPMSPKPSHQEWEPTLLNAGYHFALFDGLNRFYVRDEDREWLPVLSVPANVFDDYITRNHHWEKSNLTESLGHYMKAHELDSETYFRDVTRMTGEYALLDKELTFLRLHYERPGFRTVAELAGRWAGAARRKVVSAVRSAVLPLAGG